MSSITSEEFTLKNGKRVTIRSVEPADFQAQMDFRNQFKLETIFTWHTPLTVPVESETKKFIMQTLNSSKESFIGVFYEKRMIAQVGIHMFLGRQHPWTEHAGRFGMAILKEYWRQGLGFKLLAVMEKEMKRMGYKVIHAEVRSINSGALNLYTKFGFEVTGTQKKAAMIEGKYYDDFLIFKEIR